MRKFLKAPVILTNGAVTVSCSLRSISVGSGAVKQNRVEGKINRVEGKINRVEGKIHRVEGKNNRVSAEREKKTELREKKQSAREFVAQVLRIRVYLEGTY